MSASTRPLLDACRVYRDAQASYGRAFAKGDVQAIDDAFSRMQELGRAFRDGVCWAEEKDAAAGARSR